ncbi:MAG: sporulation transcriptional regulator SpoIIID [Clostridiales bacterium]|nr:sporulation transcriptional regulator SpoIIID [Clostridiales bacterium]
MTNNDSKNIRAVELGKYIAQTQCTVRDAAKQFGMGKSTVHKDVTERLPNLEPELSERVRKILDYNLSVRHLRGGEATKQKCAQNKPTEPAE